MIGMKMTFLSFPAQQLSFQGYTVGQYKSKRKGHNTTQMKSINPEVDANPVASDMK